MINIKAAVEADNEHLRKLAAQCLQGQPSGILSVDVLAELLICVATQAKLQALHRVQMDMTSLGRIDRRKPSVQVARTVIS